MKMLRLPDGKEIEVVKEEGKFFITKNAQFRKSLYAKCIIEKEDKKAEEKPAKKAKKAAEKPLKNKEKE